MQKRMGDLKRRYTELEHDAKKKEQRRRVGELEKNEEMEMELMFFVDCACVSASFPSVPASLAANTPNYCLGSS